MFYPVLICDIRLKTGNRELHARKRETARVVDVRASHRIALTNTSGIADSHTLDLQKLYPTRIQAKPQTSKSQLSLQWRQQMLKQL